jgi:uncharacterized membrane protein YkvA (DUF1232 family)
MIRLFRRLRFIVNIRKSVPFFLDFFVAKTVPLRHKLFSVGLIAGYLLFPFDLIPDFLGVIGVLDDITVLTWVLQKIVTIAPAELKKKYNL